MEPSGETMHRRRGGTCAGCPARQSASPRRNRSADDVRQRTFIEGRRRADGEQRGHFRARQDRFVGDPEEERSAPIPRPPGARGGGVRVPYRPRRTRRRARSTPRILSSTTPRPSLVQKRNALRGPAGCACHEFKAHQPGPRAGLAGSVGWSRSRSADFGAPCAASIASIVPGCGASMGARGGEHRVGAKQRYAHPRRGSRAERLRRRSAPATAHHGSGGDTRLDVLTPGEPAAQLEIRPPSQARSSRRSASRRRNRPRAFSISRRMSCRPRYRARF